ncbi:hypothetical protein PHYPSEUDO_006844 [Phytophthora pseudosyringae]|uniref:Uncharacterized protein n=1 Tax=Phytophthora pseudosyringae TaxID=221518 RepID=A0A8T1WBS5_9STRA|nr:hypothetical protein PHYPSEUDO_006844 [Phytophthora pseudosyringae]
MPNINKRPRSSAVPQFMALFPRASPALRVLTQDELLHHIGDFMSGVPFAVGAFAAREAKRAAAERKQQHATPVTVLYPQPRGYLPQLAIIRDELGMLELLLRVSQREENCRNPRLEFYEVIRCAVMFDRLDALHWIGERCNLADYQFEGNLLNYAVNYSGDLAVMDWLHEHVPRQFVHIRPWQLCFAASRGILAAIRWLHEHDYDGFSAGVMDAAAIAGHLEVVRYLHEHRTEGCTYEAMDMAAANGHLEVVRFLHDNRAEGCTTVAMGCAAGFGHDQVVEFLGKHRTEGPHPRALEDAAKNGHLQCVVLLCRYSSRGCLFQARKGAAKMKHQEIVEYLSSIMEANVWSCNPRRHEGDGPRRCQKNQYAMVLQRKPSRCPRSNSKARKVEGGLFSRIFGSDKETIRLCSRDVSVLHRTSESLSTHELMA